MEPRDKIDIDSCRLVEKVEMALKMESGLLHSWKDELETISVKWHFLLIDWNFSSDIGQLAIYVVPMVICHVTNYICFLDQPYKSSFLAQLSQPFEVNVVAEMRPGNFLVRGILLLSIFIQHDSGVEIDVRQFASQIVDLMNNNLGVKHMQVSLIQSNIVLGV